MGVEEEVSVVCMAWGAAHTSRALLHKNRVLLQNGPTHMGEARGVGTQIGQVSGVEGHVRGSGI